MPALLELSLVGQPQFGTIPSRQLVSRNEPFQKGWVSQPNGRGTIDILWDSLFTIFICSWSVLCLNVPAANESYWQILRRRFYLAGLAVLGPEFILQLAVGQYVSARQSVKDFYNAGISDWSFRHAFFADMGGFILKAPDYPPFPVDAKQLLYLIKNDFVEFPRITKKDIDDRNKADGIVRIIAVFQTLWFIVNSIARAIQHLAITTLELTTIAFVLPSLATFLLWAHKPSDVSTAIVLPTSAPISTILQKAGDQAASPFQDTPLDFASRREWSWTRYWSFWTNLLRDTGIASLGPKGRPVDRIRDDNWPMLTNSSLSLLSILHLGYAAVQVCGWNFDLPTPTEKLLWRISSMALLVAITIVIFVESMFRLLPYLNRNTIRTSTIVWRTRSASHSARWLITARVPRFAGKVTRYMRNNTPQRDKSKTIRLRALLPVSLCGLVYTWARIYMLTEDFVALRALPRSAYQTVNWSQFIPHV